MRKNYYYVFLFSLILFIGQLFTGTQTETAFFFSTAIFFGLYAIFATGKFSSMLGLLNFAIILKYLLFGVIVKTIFLQPSDSPLFAPLQTSQVAAIGFAGVLLGTVIQRKLPVPKTRLIYPISDKNFYLVLYVFLLITGYGSWLYLYLTRQDTLELEATVGGPFGFLTAFGELRNLAITAALYYVSMCKSKRILSHPLVIFTLVVATLAGIYSVSKQGMIEPLVYFFLSVLAIKGPRYKPLWVILIVGALVFTNIIYPFSQYARYAGGRSGSTAERITVMADILPKLILDPEYRNTINTSVDKNLHKFEAYLPVAGYSLGRFAMVAEADRLIAASTYSQPTGWETITWGFKMVLPRFIYSDKPILAPNNFLAHKAGYVGANDYLTQVSFGFMANFYNAFGFPGVIIGSIVLIVGLYQWLTLFFGNSQDITIWTIAVFGQYNHQLSEQSVAGIISSIWFALIAYVPFFIAKYISKKMR